MKRILIPTIKSYEYIFVMDIISFESDQGMTIVRLKQQSFTSTDSLATLMDKCDCKELYRCHNSYAINLNEILRVFKENTVQMSNDMIIPVSRRRFNELIDRLS